MAIDITKNLTFLYYYALAQGKIIAQKLHLLIIQEFYPLGWWT
jgi:hypothetical protein